MALEPRHVLAGRYRFVRRVEKARAPAWFAIDEETGRPVVASVIPQDRAPALANAVGLAHPHLAALLHVVLDATLDSFPPEVSVRSPSPIAVVEHITGEVLSAKGALAIGARDDRVRQVEAFAKLVSAVSALHRRSVFHGAISPLSVVVGRSDGGTVPLLTQLLMPPMSWFASPERAKSGPSIVDDVWAMYSLLYAVLSGHATLDSVARTGRDPERWRDEASSPNEGELRELVVRGLHRAPEDRIISLADLEADLVVWLAHEGVRDSPLEAESPSFEGDLDARASPPPAIEIGSFDEEDIPPSEPPALDPAPDLRRAVESDQRLTIPAGAAYSGVVATEVEKKPPPPLSRAEPSPSPSNQEIAAATFTPKRIRAVVIAVAAMAIVIEAFMALASSDPRPTASSSESASAPLHSTPLASATASSAALSVREIKSAQIPISAPDTTNPTACATSFFPDGTFAVTQDLAYICAPMDGTHRRQEALYEPRHRRRRPRDRRNERMGAPRMVRARRLCRHSRCVLPRRQTHSAPSVEPPCDPLGPDARSIGGGGGHGRGFRSARARVR